jgi:ABC-2 type transport system ATP-binding protein
MLAPSQLVVSARGLWKQFGRKVAVRDVDLDVERGEIVGFLGPNGAGKTTVMNMITGLSRLDRGELVLFGVPGGSSDPMLRSRLGYLQERPCIYPELSAPASLRLFAALYQVPDATRRIDELIDRMSLRHAEDRPLSTFSRGMQQRTCLARAMLHRPDFLVLDEPTLGLDPVGVSEMRDNILDLNRSGVALLFSSHQLAEVERICDRVILMNRGEIVDAGSTRAITRRIAGMAEAVAEVHAVTTAVMASLRALPIVTGVARRDENHLDIGLDAGEGDATAVRSALSSAIARAGGVVLSVTLRAATLEDAFLQMTRGSWPSITPDTASNPSVQAQPEREPAGPG